MGKKGHQRRKAGRVKKKLVHTKTRKRYKDIDQIQDEIKKYDPKQKLPKDEELPGLGQYFCPTCSRYFITEVVLATHNASKLHKKRVKAVNDKPYSQAEADWAAGKGPVDNKQR